MVARLLSGGLLTSSLFYTSCYSWLPCCAAFCPLHLASKHTPQKSTAWSRVCSSWSFPGCVLLVRLRAFDRFQAVHQGLYLGFNGRRSTKSPEMHALWHNNGLPVTVFNHAVDPTLASNDTMSLFNLGSVFVDAAIAVQYAALHPDSTQAKGVPLALNRQWQFMQTNGPGIMAESYLHSLDYIVRTSKMLLWLASQLTHAHVPDMHTARLSGAAVGATGPLQAAAAHVLLIPVC